MQYFNPLSSCEERQLHPCRTVQLLLFQSTLLMRGETWTDVKAYMQKDISIHSPHARRDTLNCYINACNIDFNPLSSCEERLDEAQLLFNARISIHSPHARRDLLPFFILRVLENFNPLSSCEERPWHLIHIIG